MSARLLKDVAEQDLSELCLFSIRREVDDQVVVLDAVGTLLDLRIESFRRCEDVTYMSRTFRPIQIDCFTRHRHVDPRSIHLGKVVCSLKGLIETGIRGNLDRPGVWRIHKLRRRIVKGKVHR